MFKKNENRARILIVDDEPFVRNLLREILSEDYECVDAGSAEEALALLRIETFNLVISDIQMVGINGLDMIPLVIKLAPDICIIMISGMQNIESPIKAMRAGAFDYITKPFDFEHVEAIVKRAIENQSLRLTKKLYDNHLEEQVVLRTAELHEEIIERQRAEEKVNRMAYYDSLTNLPNPALFKDRLTHELGKPRNSRKMSAVIFLALDRFKNIGDTLGHSIGDELLRLFAERLANLIRKTDTAAYFGGSEFALLATEISSVEDCVKIAQKIKHSLIKPFNCAGHELYITVTFGISLAPNDGGDCQTLLKNASTSLHRARQIGNDTYQFYTVGMHELALKSLSLENSLRRGLEREEFVLWYQPQICAESGKITGTEALVRWQHPELGFVSPLEFIPIAEATGLIVPLGEWVLRTACEQNVAWQRAGYTDLRVGVNISLRQFQQSNLTETISRILADSGLEPQYLELELTESLLMENRQVTVETLRELRNLGIKISIDDFGSGYSSLAYLKNLPLDTLKIDRTFVTDISGDSCDAAIIKTIITLARNLRLKTIAEGVETKEQSTILSALGCDEMQGYLFSKPLAAEALENILKERQIETLNFIEPQRAENYLNV
ncbi:MAG TPA: EAL domain-containing protein [Pyrinomonadaceae bacterium]|nr:EAL domain-containing protein [Pyrinomonadaceae bacterium]